MDEIFQKLFESDLLSESTKAELKEQCAQAILAFKQEVREATETEVRAELIESWQTEMGQLSEKADKLIAEALEKEIAEFKADVERFRDHEVTAANEALEARKQMAVTVAEEMDTLVNKLDAFMESRLTAEFEELHEELELAKQNQLGMEIFEAFKDKVAKTMSDDGSVHAQLRIAESKLEAATQKAKKLETEKAEMIRESKMADVLSPLTGSAKEQMAFILKNVPNEKLEESYKTFLPRILRESVESPEKTQLDESQQASKTEVKTGDKPALNESKSQEKPQYSEQVLALRRMAGLN